MSSDERPSYRRPSDTGATGEGSSGEGPAEERTGWRAPSRRQLLVGGAVTLAATSVGLSRVIESRQPPARVHSLRCVSYDEDLVGLIREGLSAFPDLLKRVRGARVLLKPNLVEIHADRPINTHPKLIVAAAQAFLEAGARSVVVGEGPGHTRDIEAVLEQSGLDRALSEPGVPFIDLNAETPVGLRLPANLTGLGELPIAAAVLAADLVVSMPKLKTHHWAGATLSMKNLFGTVPGRAFGWPKNSLHHAGINRSILDLWSAIRPAFAIIDGVVAMEGDGPIMGTAVPHGVLLMSDNLPALDATAARLMELEPSRIPSIKGVVRLGGTIAEGRIERTGDTIASRPYKVVKHLNEMRAGWLPLILGG